MKRERTLNLAWPLVALLAVLLLGGGAWGVGAILFEDPATRKSYPSKTVAGYLGVGDGGLVELQNAPRPKQGQVLVAGCGTNTAAGTNTATCAQFVDSPSGLPSGTPGQVAGIKTVTVSTTTTGTSTATASATAYQAVNGTLYAGSNVTLSRGTDTNTSSAVDLADNPRIHAASGAYSFSTVTPAAVGTSGSVGTSTLLQRADHVHGYTLPLSTSTPAAVGTSGSAGVATSVSRSDHVHQRSAPAAHASSHITGGADVIASATSSAVGLMSTAHYNLLNGVTSNPTASRIPYSNASGKLTTWIDAASSSVAGLLSTSHYNILQAVTTTPGTWAVPNTGSTGNLNLWITGNLVQQLSYTMASDYSPADNTWVTVDPHTFTALGSKFRVTVQANFFANDSISGYWSICGLGVMADTGATASTLRGPQSWTPQLSSGGASNTILFPHTQLQHPGIVVAEFTLSDGQVTIGAALFDHPGTQAGSCRLHANHLTVYVDVYK